MNNQQNDTADQLLYVVAGAGTVRVKDQSYKADAGWFALIPRGVSHSIAREGRNPLFLMMVAMGAPCTDTSAAGEVSVPAGGHRFCWRNRRRDASRCCRGSGA